MMYGTDRFFAAEDEQTIRDFIALNKPPAFIGPVQIDAVFVARLNMRDNVVWVDGIKEVTEEQEQRTITSVIGGW